jgi:hypothetical protein
MANIIKTGFCVAYDWEMLRKSIPIVYEHSDIICLALDKNRKSWAGNPYEFDNKAFYQFVEEIDKDKKIILYEDDFALPDLNSRQNCNRHRMLIAEKMGKGGWHIQIDSDEYFLDFAGFAQYLKKLNPNPTGQEKPLNVSCPFIALLKKVDEGYLYVDFKDRLPEIIPMATTLPDYQRARQNGHFNHYANFYVIHETWARSDEELWYKINNWGHASEELEEKKARESYFELWKALDSRNYQYIRDFHPASPTTWTALGFCEGKDIDGFMQNFQVPEFPLSKFQLSLKNNRNMARFKSIWSKILKTK